MTIVFRGLYLCPSFSGTAIFWFLARTSFGLFVAWGFSKNRFEVRGPNSLE